MEDSQQGERTTRRAFLRQVLTLGGVSAGAAILNACGLSSTVATPAASTSAPSSDATAVANAATSAPDVAATAEATTGPVPTEASSTETATASTGESANPAIVAAANAFLATLSDTEKDSVLFDWTDSEQKQRWSNLPEGLYTRAGLMWGDMSETQHTAWLALMQTTLSTEGYNRVIAEWNADDQLASTESGGATSATAGAGTGGGAPAETAGAGGAPSGTAGAGPGGDGGAPSGTAGAGGGFGGGGSLLYGTEYYWVALIGTPSETDAWQWQWGGHHVTVNATLSGSDIALTPSFIGVQPGEYTDADGNTVRPLGDIDDEAFALINSLDETQLQAAVLGESVIDLVLGPGQDGKVIQSEGLPASDMTAEQQTAFLQLISHYTNLVNETAAAARLAEVQSTLDDTYLAWYGPTTEGSSAYFRVTGPTIVIEYSPQGGGGTGTGLGGDATKLHVHGIYRDPTNDYGAKYTGVTVG